MIFQNKSSTTKPPISQILIKRPNYTNQTSPKKPIDYKKQKRKSTTIQNKEPRFEPSYCPLLFSNDGKKRQQQQTQSPVMSSER